MAFRLAAGVSEALVALCLAACIASDPPCAATDSSADQANVTACDGLYAGSGSPYETGALRVRTIQIAKCEGGAPRGMVVYTPERPGSYAVVVYQHGLTVSNTASSGVLLHLASHGFVVVAPAMYESATPALLGVLTEVQEARQARMVVDWLGRLDEFTGVHACTARLGLAGHSRGGKIVWLELVTDPSFATAVAGVDPTDGTGYPLGGQPRVINGPFGFSLSTLIIGTGTGGPCAPEGDNHLRFYEASGSAAWYIYLVHGGHADMLDEDSPDFARIKSYCGGGDNPTGTRLATAGLLAAFFRGTLQGDATALAYLTDIAAAPVEIVVETK